MDTKTIIENLKSVLVDSYSLFLKTHLAFLFCSKCVRSKIPTSSKNAIVL